MAGPASSRIPNLEQITWRAASSRHHSIPGLSLFIQDPNELSLAHPLPRHLPEDFILQLFFPPSFQSSDRFQIGPIRLNPRFNCRIQQRLERLASISPKRYGTLFVSIMSTDIDIDKLHSRILKCRLRTGGKIS